MKSRALRFILIAIFLIAIAVIAQQYLGPKFGQANDKSTTVESQEVEIKTLADIVVEDKIYATVNNETITGADVKEFAAALPVQLQQAPGENLLNLIVNQLVNDQLIMKSAMNSGLTSDAEIQKQVAEMEKQLIRETYIKRNINDTITDAELQAKYQEMLANTPDVPEIRARHILLKTEQDAKDVIAELDKGADFVELAKEKSTGPSAPNGGDLGFFNQTTMVKEFADAAFAMDVDTYSQTPVETQFGYHVIKVEEKRMQPKPEFAAVETRVRAQVMDEKIRAHIDELRAQANVTLDIPELNTPAPATSE